MFQVVIGFFPGPVFSVKFDNCKLSETYAPGELLVLAVQRSIVLGLGGREAGRGEGRIL
jgi:hypothetical protein